MNCSSVYETAEEPTALSLRIIFCESGSTQSLGNTSCFFPKNVHNKKILSDQ